MHVLSILGIGCVASNLFFWCYWYPRYNKRAVSWWRSEIKNHDVSEIEGRVKQLADTIFKEIEPLCSHLPDEVDLVCSGGGFKTAYAAGVLYMARLARERCGKLNVNRRAGTSAGAQIIYGMSPTASKTTDKSRKAEEYDVDVDAFTDMLNWAVVTSATLQKFKFMFPKPMWEEYWPALVHRRGLLAPGEMHVSITEIQLFCCCGNNAKRTRGDTDVSGGSSNATTSSGSSYRTSWWQRFWPPVRFVNHVVDDFHSEADLGNSLMATSTIPGIMAASLWRWYRGMRTVDGGVTKNVPYFEDQVRPQMVMRFHDFPAEMSKKVLYFTQGELLDLVELGFRDFKDMVQREANFAQERGERAARVVSFENCAEAELDDRRRSERQQQSPVHQVQHRLELISPEVATPKQKNLVLYTRL